MYAKVSYTQCKKHFNSLLFGKFCKSVDNSNSWIKVKFELHLLWHCNFHSGLSYRSRNTFGGHCKLIYETKCGVNSTKIQHLQYPNARPVIFDEIKTKILTWTTFSRTDFESSISNRTLYFVCKYSEMKYLLNDSKRPFVRWMIK